MVKMHDIRRTKADVAAEKKVLGVSRKDGDGQPSVYVPPEDDGARMEFEHHHLVKMGLGGDLKSGDTVHFHGHGTVERSETRSSPEGDKHSATIRFHHGAIEHEAEMTDAGERGKLRGDIESAHAKAENAKQVKKQGSGSY